MQPILVSYEAPFRCNLQKKYTGPVSSEADAREKEGDRERAREMEWEREHE